PAAVRHALRALPPQTAIHIATEGPLGLAARYWLKARGMPYTTAVHTKFPEYLEARLGRPLPWAHRALRRFHQGAAATLCATPSHRDELMARGFRKLQIWGRGVDTRRFRPGQRNPRSGAGPLLLYVGRVAPEKNLRAFLRLATAGVQLRVVGDGPSRAVLQAQFPQVEWSGFLQGDALVQAYRDADVMVFPSRTDTFGLVLLEAIACGTPVAAYPVPGPRDVVTCGVNGALHRDLQQSIGDALGLDRGRVAASAGAHSWRAVTRAFLEAQVVPPLPAMPGSRSPQPPLPGALAA
ncbi:MAG: glycosyltransferase, partial [Pseudomonadota bacterium]